MPPTTLCQELLDNYSQLLNTETDRQIHTVLHMQLINTNYLHTEIKDYKSMENTDKRLFSSQQHLDLKPSQPPMQWA